MATSIEDLPRLTDEEHDALDDGYTAIEGVSAPARPEHIDSNVFLWVLAAIFVFVVIPMMVWTFRDDKPAEPPQPEPEQPPDQEWAHYAAAQPLRDVRAERPSSSESARPAP